MTTTSRLVSAICSSLPGILFLTLFLGSSLLGRDYWWGTYLTVLCVLVICGLAFGFTLPPIFQKLGLRHPWTWILLQGLLAWIAALIVLALLNLSPLCVGQNNGDGNNTLGMCMFMTVLSGTVYSPVYLGLLVLSAMIGHRVLKGMALPVQEDRQGSTS
jgi:hypothetical protein